MTLDLVIRGGTVFDGSGAPGFVADVAVTGGRVVEVGRIDTPADREIDASGLYVSPGFIDIHSHSDYTLLVDPRAVSSIAQGVTLEVLGNCGHGCFPLVDKALARNSIYGVSSDVPLDWGDAAGYLERLDVVRPAVNVATLVPNGQLRQATVGLAARPAEASERRAMLNHMEASLDAGAIGFSTGLEYPIEAHVPAEEIEALLAPVARRGLLYATHTRHRDHGAVAAVEEALHTARAMDVRVQVSHLLPRGGRTDCERCVEAVEGARAGGQDVHFDMHTRAFSFTFLHAMLPAWALDGGLGALRALLRDDGARARIRAHPSIVSGGGWDRVTLVENTVVGEFSNMTFDSIGAALGLHPADAALELLCRAAEAERPLMITRPIYAPEDQSLAFGHDLCMPGSDATALAPDGPLSGTSFYGAYSWAAWFYRFAVRERRFLKPEAAIHKMTGLPAAVLNLHGRGRLVAGAHADIAVFDPTRFGERATDQNPNRVAQGMAFVVVNGAVALDNHTLTNRRAGHVIRHH